MSNHDASLLPSARLIKATELRKRIAEHNFRVGFPTQTPNGDEELYPTKIASYSKGLKHKDDGEVDLASYKSYVAALKHSDPQNFEQIELGNLTPLIALHGGLALELEGDDSHAFTLRAAPRFASREQAAEIAENYWMAALRDIPFAEYTARPETQAAAADLSLFGADSKTPKDASGKVTPALLFRGLSAGDAVGPYISQFLYKVPTFGPYAVNGQLATYQAGANYMTGFDTWLAVQRGVPQPPAPTNGPTRFIINARDLSRYVHVDVMFQAYQMAAIFLQNSRAPLNPANPYHNVKKVAWIGMFAELAQVTALAARAAFYPKWFVHRRLRPEAFAERVDRALYHSASYPVHADILQSLSSASRLGGFIPSGNAFLSQAYPEGSPTHPAYPAAHAVLAGACVTLLKATYDESWVIPSPKVPTADGLDLIDYAGPALKLGPELDKLASNIALGRNIAGVHWRSDGTEGLLLGEQVAIHFLREAVHTFHEPMHFAFTSLQGQPIKI